MGHYPPIVHGFLRGSGSLHQLCNRRLGDAAESNEVLISLTLFRPCPPGSSPASPANLPCPLQPIPNINICWPPIKPFSRFMPPTHPRRHPSHSSVLLLHCEYCNSHPENPQDRPLPNPGISQLAGPLRTLDKYLKCLAGREKPRC